MVCQMAEPVQLFCHWSAEFDVALVPPNSGQGMALLHFVPRRARARPLRREWFTYWHRQSLTGKAALQPVNLLLRLATFDRYDWETESFRTVLTGVAQELGPLFSLLPGHRAAEAAFLEESVEDWWKAAQSVRELGRMLERLPEMSRDGSKTARKRRALQVAAAEYPGDWKALTAEQKRQFSEPYRESPGISPRHQAEGHLSGLIDQLWFPAVNLPGVPTRLSLPHLRLNEEQTSLQINVPTGMQALLVMALQDRRLGRSLLIRECARPACQVVAFMSPTQRYCSGRCRNAAGVQRHAEKVNRKATGKGSKPRGSTT